MTDSILSKAATMEIPISSNGDSRMAEDDSLEQDLQQVMVSGPNLNETSIVSGGYGGAAEGIIPTTPSMHHSNSNPSMMSEEATKGVAVEKLDSMKKWSINTYKCTKQMFSEHFGRGTKTVDMELEAQIDVLRETKMKMSLAIMQRRKDCYARMERRSWVPSISLCPALIH
uniref:ADP-ribosylation factor interacting protein 2a n=1 Tax=Sinocyclocheilus rhinocerous TaxID=307959 RepID=A0A673IRM3_9TELE